MIWYYTTYLDGGFCYCCQKRQLLRYVNYCNKLIQGGNADWGGGTYPHCTCIHLQAHPWCKGSSYILCHIIIKDWPCYLQHSVSIKTRVCFMGLGTDYSNQLHFILAKRVVLVSKSMAVLCIKMKCVVEIRVQHLTKCSYIYLCHIGKCRSVEGVTSHGWVVPGLRNTTLVDVINGRLRRNQIIVWWLGFGGGILQELGV